MFYVKIFVPASAVLLLFSLPDRIITLLTDQRGPVCPRISLNDQSKKKLLFRAENAAKQQQQHQQLFKLATDGCMCKFPECQNSGKVKQCFVVALEEKVVPESQLHNAI